jgi:hypothetical protein
MTVKDLGRLERVDLRDIWLSEASDFTPWLARKENLDILGQTLVIDLELEAQERPVGPFRADILCKDIGSDRWVLIENQLERTDHNHLGQLLTYASGLEAVTIVWIAAHFTEEHRSTLDWLNRITDGSFRFFGLEVELWRIGDSPPAPKFNIVSKPNDWSQSVAQAALLPNTAKSLARHAADAIESASTLSSRVSQLDRTTSLPDDEEISALIKLGQDLLKNGDFSSARLLLKRAAEAGSAGAALSLGETFDPLLIQRLGAIGVQPDATRAHEWYKRAAQLGSDAALQRLAKLAQAPQ